MSWFVDLDVGCFYLLGLFLWLFGVGCYFRVCEFDFGFALVDFSYDFGCVLIACYSVVILVIACLVWFVCLLFC